ncbi:FadR/GntR family transcriptional regulator [Bacillus sp. cl95]|uniref:FadR/GntR family transcriptional regulator n=1 Tax=Bacillus sp. cl95 TaxID=1761761 RepID=UPI0008DEBAE3|nr:GntR family transcriptional regulator [Bacillus sp. cl95]SFB17364.1 DNA-binding transcriptional regulator, FadR family [Bacillus sp. UNCCL13]SFQ77207.1 DNA-binding transcriptional regulator, FadR family [Bacillus sp. cl95]
MTKSVETAKQSSKVYIEIVKHLRTMISADGLKSGDKLPSERELSERLNVGRSSVREALRALELLGLIETRRGEGTFIRDFKGNQLVQLLSTFILQDEKAKYDVVETKYFIEMDCLRLALQKGNGIRIAELKGLLRENVIDDDQFFSYIVRLAENHLFSRIWLILKDYYRSLSFDELSFERSDYLVLIEALANQNEKMTLEAYRKLRKMSNS